VHRSPAETIAAFDEAFNAGNIDALMSVFSNRASMRMPSNVVIETDPYALRMAFTTLIASRPIIRNQIHTLIPSGDLILAIIK
ncbi:hydrolase, partial [Pantoea dispersa]